MVRVDLVRAKIGRLRNTISALRACLPAEPAGLAAGRDVLDLTSFRVYLSMQEAIDLAAHIIADQAWGPLGTLREHFSMLASKGVISSSLAVQLSAAVKVRNLIGHAYVDVDAVRLHAAATELIPVLASFSADVLAFAEANAT